jgi:hypothetical protein
MAIDNITDKEYQTYMGCQQKAVIVDKLKDKIFYDSIKVAVGGSLIMVGGLFSGVYLTTLSNSDYYSHPERAIIMGGASLLLGVGLINRGIRQLICDTEEKCKINSDVENTEASPEYKRAASFVDKAISPQ